jgi:phospholipid transport system substrate-binding protein
MDSERQKSAQTGIPLLPEHLNRLALNLQMACDDRRLRRIIMRVTKMVGAFVLVVGLALPAAASQPTAESFMKDRQGELSALVKSHAPGSAKKIETVFDAILDYEALAKGSLRADWEARTEAERKEFQDVLKQLVQRAYRKNLDHTASYDVRFEGESQENAAFLVRTVAQSRTNAREEPIAIDYVVHREGPSFRIQDIITEGSSLVGNYHQQFTRIIKKDGFPGLLRRMKAKLANRDAALAP